MPLEHTVVIGEAFLPLAREKSNSVPLSSNFRRKVVVVLVVNIRDICYYKIHTENGIINASRYLDFLKRLMDRRHGNRKHAVRLFNNLTTDHHASVTSWIERKDIQRCLEPLLSDLNPCNYGAFYALKKMGTYVSLLIYLEKSQIEKLHMERK